MPDVKIRMALDLFDSSDADYEFRDRVAEHVAAAMSCKNDRGEWIYLDPFAMIDPQIMFYGPEARLNADVILEIAALDFADRMNNIKDRLRAIREAVRMYLPEGKKLSLSFIPLRQDCWIGDTDEEE